MLSPIDNPQMLPAAVAFLLGVPVRAAELPLLPPPIYADHSDTKLVISAFFVDPKDSDGNGERSIAKTFETIRRAATAAERGDTVYLQTGIYRESVRPLRSGTPEHPTTFTSYLGERAQINGTDLVAGPWVDIKSQGIHVTCLHGRYQSDQNFARQIFMDGRMINLARWPNTSLDVSRPVKSSVSVFVSKTHDKAAGLTPNPDLGALSTGVTPRQAGCNLPERPQLAPWSPSQLG